VKSGGKKDDEGRRERGRESRRGGKEEMRIVRMVIWRTVNIRRSWGGRVDLGWKGKAMDGSGRTNGRFEDELEKGRISLIERAIFFTLFWRISLRKFKERKIDESGRDATFGLTERKRSLHGKSGTCGGHKYNKVK
jgi:hypothetical protein